MQQPLCAVDLHFECVNGRNVRNMQIADEQDRVSVCSLVRGAISALILMIFFFRFRLNTLFPYFLRVAFL